MFRKILFWTHLASGVTTGLVVAMMSVTGVLLTYERQMLSWLDRSQYSDAAPGAVPQPLEALIAGAKLERADFTPSAVVVRRDPAAPLSLTAGRSGTLLVDRYTGAVLEPGGERLRAFFDALTGWHRWFNATGESRATARAITGASNLLFLFLIVSGMYLWLPRIWKWAAFRTRLAFNSKAQTSKARDFNWHHVFGIWSALPLAVVVATATVFSYPWANNLVYRTVGEEPPVRGGPGAPAAARGPGAAQSGARDGGGENGGTRGAHAGDARPALPFDALLERAAAHAGEWQAITLNLPEPNAPTVRFSIDQGNGGQPQRRHALTLDAYSGGVAAWEPFTSQTAGQQLRSWIRFLHTGEALGVVGQTIAGLVSLTSVLMVWTGLALAYRRLIAPLFARRARATGKPASTV
jgi:uncharacterized iron-regulated membrane protein